MSLANDELDESQITAMDLPIEFKVTKITILTLIHFADVLTSLVESSEITWK